MRARELLSLLKAGAVDGLSIGYRTVRGQIDPKSRVRRLYQVDLWEISIVTFPLLNGARVSAVKRAAPSCRGCARRRRRNGVRCWRGRTSAHRGAAGAAGVEAGERGGRKTALRGVSGGK